jgi:diguanylate cyclase (GGDEF)-like protein
MVLLDITESKTLNTEIKSLISTIPGGVLKTTADNWKILFASDSLATLMGYEPIEFKERFGYFNECVHNLDLAYFLQTIGKKPDVIYLELRLIKKDGSAVWVAINATKSLLENNESIYQSVIIDSTSQKEVSLELKKELDRSTIVMEMIDEFICEYFVDEDRLISSRKCAEVLGLDLIVEGFYQRIQNTKVIHPDDIPAFLEYYTHFDETQKENRLDLRLRHKSGEYIWYMLKGATLYEDGLPYKIIAKLTDINEEKNKITALMDISVRDSFTGVYNAGNTPRFINEYLQSEEGSGQHALLMIDIDNFKNVNDKYGHDVGDKLIKEFSSRIITFFGSGALIGRVGGDEFVVLIKDIAEDKVVGYVEKLKRKLYEEYVFDGIIITFSTSFGISIIPRDGNQYETLFKKADLACYQAKNHGKNTIRVFTDDMLASPLNLTTIAYDSTESSLMMMD